ncbi:MAG: RsmB/NOP family class I SAM-dependent RNA methyltransferase, partial [Candidatus Altiarchaeota archaeon]|nr:RsmB/NOP family class I SAM-dependent RNA methyltransferase [Candidatus Altiarchaeota archaeon]
MKNSNKFEERCRLLADDADILFEYMHKPLRKSLRANTLKTSTLELASRLRAQGHSLVPIPWAKDGFWTDNPGISDTIEHFLGHYYIQESSAMLPPIILAPSEGDVVLDAAAAPGGKTTHLAALMNNRGCLAANEPDFRRRSALRFNLSKYGVLNAIITTQDLTAITPQKPIFDRILLDAPCSCEGQFRKNILAAEQWTLSKVIRHSRLQKKLLENCLKMLKSGGTIVYSTCTLAPEENEEVIDDALNQNTGLRIEKIGSRDFKYRPGIKEWMGHIFNPAVENCARIHPQDNDSEGFFIAKMT